MPVRAAHAASAHDRKRRVRSPRALAAFGGSGRPHDQRVTTRPGSGPLAAPRHHARRSWVAVPVHLHGLCGTSAGRHDLPPDLRDWLPQGHLAWFLLDIVDQVELEPFLRFYRTDGHGHPASDPKTLLGVLLYGYCIGVRSSRQIERRCHEDSAFRVLAGNQTPDHVTIARFRVRHQQATATTTATTPPTRSAMVAGFEGPS
ncbi:MAG TPA: transposase [Actinomycetes bacterium]|nr:transposase [Actinomycetes bacterium]